MLTPTFVKPRVAVYPLTPARRPVPRSSHLITDTLTVDAGDEQIWRFVDLDRGTVVVPPDTTGWDLALRRFHVIPSGGIVDLGPVPFESVTAAPENGYLASRFSHDTSNAATDHWYRYSYFNHLLSPKPDVYVLRTREGRYAKLQILSYYCTGSMPGCITVRYVFQASGDRSFLDQPAPGGGR